VISACGRSRRANAANKAELILDKMMLLFDLSESEKMKLNAQHFLAGPFVALSSTTPLCSPLTVVLKSYTRLLAAESTSESAERETSFRSDVGTA
jgi:hypothetical protein